MHLTGNDNHGGKEMDLLAKEYASEHGCTYREALSALLKEHRLEERELRQRFANRVEAYAYDFKKYSEANDDPDPMTHYYDSLVGDTLNEAKRRHGEEDISLPDAMLEILQGEPATAKRIAGNWLNHTAMNQIAALGLTGQVAEVYPGTLEQVRTAFPEVTDMADNGNTN